MRKGYLGDPMKKEQHQAPFSDLPMSYSISSASMLWLQTAQMEKKHTGIEQRSYLHSREREREMVLSINTPTEGEKELIMKFVSSGGNQLKPVRDIEYSPWCFISNKKFTPRDIASLCC